VLLDICSAFVSRNHEVHLVLMNNYPSALWPLIPRGVEVVDLKCPRFWTSQRATLRYLRARRPDGIVAAMPLANAIAGYARALAGVAVRLVLTEHNSRSLVFGDLDLPAHRVLAPFVRFGYRFADCIIAVSEGVAAKLRDLPGVPPDRVRVVYNPAYAPRIESMALEPVPHPWLEDSSMPVLVASGRLEAQKDFATLLRAFALLRNRRPARLVILGQGSLGAQLQALADELSVSASVLFPGYVLNPWAYMGRASAFVLSSAHEGLPGVLVEALGLGIPVVSTDCPTGPSEILDRGRYGRLVPVHDPASLARAIEHALDTPVDRDQLKRRAREFSLEAAAAAYLDALGLTGPG